MPIYEYICEKCGNEFEEIVFDDTPPVCTQCGKNDTRRLMSRPARRSSKSRGGDYAPASGSSGGCAGCSGGNCASCGH